MIPGSSSAEFFGAAGAAGAGYEISRSLRFNSADSAYLSRTPASAGNRRTYTWSGWVKRAALGSGTYYLFTAVDGANVDIIGFEADRFYWYNSYSGSVNSQALYRDPSAWYHVLASVDSTQATDSDRVKLYVNGAEIVYNAVLYPSLNRDFAVNNTVTHKVGQYFTTNSSDFYLADVHFIDGQALDPTSFTEVSATTGQLIPKAYSGTYGTNGFHLPFSDNSTAAALGTDTSGNSNTWTVNNISVAAGAGNDSLTDTPTSYGVDAGVGGEVRGNYCTLNPLVNAAYNTYSNGNLECAFPGATTGATAVGTLAVSSGKWYWELNRNDISAGLLAGIARIDTNTLNLIGSNATSYAYKDSNGNKINNGTSTAYGATWNSANIIGVALDLDAGTLVFYKDGVSQGTAFSGLSGTFYPAFSEDNAGSASGVAANFGQRPFAYTAPSGFKALCTTNLPDPVVAQPSTVMDVVTYTGTGAARSISGLGFGPDFVWIKNRNVARSHRLFDAVRGATIRLYSDTTGAEGTDATSLTQFNADGFNLEGNAGVNNLNDTYVAWAWDAGSSTVTNTQGSITSTVRANPSAGFSIVSFVSGSTSSYTVGHGLGVTPEFMIFKDRDTAGQPWTIYHKSLGSSQYLLFSTAAAASASWGGSPTSSVFYGSTTFFVSSKNIIGYCFAPVAGYSSFGSYTGNGSTDGPFVYTGFKSRWIMIKASSASSAYTSWGIWDSERNPDNVNYNTLFANLATPEGYRGDGTSTASLTQMSIDNLSNGFKIRNNGNEFNVSAVSYVYAAFAESPFQYARAR